MNRYVSVAVVTATCIALAPSIASAHIIPWRAGESRTVGFGHCAKGACTKRVYWGDSKPHRHVGGKVVFERIVSRLHDH